MRRRVFLLAALVSALFVAPAPGQGFFSKKKTNKPSPAERLSQLITTLKTDQDEAKREDAAAELRQFDPKTYPEVIPVLIECLQNDPRPAVRMEAAQSLGRLPVSQQAGWALEQAASKDSSTRVRLQARSSLWYLKARGYRSEGKPPEDPNPPPKANTPPSLVPVPKTTRPGATPAETPPPPLAIPPGVPQPSGPAKAGDRGPDLLPPDR